MVIIFSNLLLFICSYVLLRSVTVWCKHDAHEFQRFRLLASVDRFWALGFRLLASLDKEELHTCVMGTSLASLLMCEEN